jgi:hypothetical protein
MILTLLIDVDNLNLFKIKPLWSLMTKGEKVVHKDRKKMTKGEKVVHKDRKKMTKGENFDIGGEIQK